MAVWGVDLLVSIIPSSVPRLKEVGVDARALGFALLISLVTGLFFGLAPAWQASQSDVAESLKEGAAGKHRTRASSVFAARWSSRKSLSRSCCLSARDSSLKVFIACERLTLVSMQRTF
ncbi:MAG: hypothetical protein WKF84_09680 [Pyrinomonadaceae bacterium]